MISKKGQGMSISTVILLVLGLAVLVVLILGFTMGWSKMAPFLSGSNVDDIASACSSSCSLGSKYDYCSAPRELKDLDKNTYKTSCEVLASEDSLSIYGVESCAKIDCGLTCDKIKINGVEGKIFPTGQEFGTNSVYDVTSIAVDVDENSLCLIVLEE